MAESTRAAANRANALASTGPRTSAGKSRSAANAIRHGLRSQALVIPGERQADWQRHLDGVLSSVNPQNYLEAFLAADVAGQAWRLARVSRYETAALAMAQETAEEDRDQAIGGLRRDLGLDATLPELRARVEEAEARVLLVELLADDLAGRVDPAAPVPAVAVWAALGDLHPALDPEEVVELPGFTTSESRFEGAVELEWLTWTPDLFRAAAEQVAAAAGVTLVDCLPEARRAAQAHLAYRQAQVELAEAEVDRLKCSRMLPDTAQLDRIQRYESHLRRGLARTLEQLVDLRRSAAGHDQAAEDRKSVV